MVRVSSKLPDGDALTYVAGENKVILGIFNDFQNLLNSAINFGAGTANKDDIFCGWIVCLSPNFDAECFLLADNPTHVIGTRSLGNERNDSRIKSSTTFADDSAVPLLFDCNDLAFHIRCIFGPLDQFLLSLLNVLGFLHRRWGGGWGGRIVHQ